MLNFYEELGYLRNINGVQEIGKVFEDIEALIGVFGVMIVCKTPRELEIMREAGRIVALTHQELKKSTLFRISQQRSLTQLRNKPFASMGHPLPLKDIMVSREAFVLL
ncbi:hypothetical protein GCM10020331_017410 [Ectobacillus funiculus]